MSTSVETRQIGRLQRTATLYELSVSETGWKRKASKKLGAGRPQGRPLSTPRVSPPKIPVSARFSLLSRAVLMLRVIVALAILAVWEGLSRSGFFYGEVIPSLTRIVASLGKLMADPVFYKNLQVTALETFTSLAIGTVLGVVTAIVLGGNRFLMRAFEPYIYYLSPMHRPRGRKLPLLIIVGGQSEQKRPA